MYKCESIGQGVAFLEFLAAFIWNKCVNGRTIVSVYLWMSLCVLVVRGCLCLCEWPFIGKTKNTSWCLSGWTRRPGVFCVFLCALQGEHKPKVIGFCFPKEWVGKVRDKRVALLLGYLAQHGCVCWSCWVQKQNQQLFIQAHTQTHSSVVIFDFPLLT